jgi:adenosine deaminase
VRHAGETTGPETVWHALNALRAERIGHGITAVQDPALLAHLSERAIPLEISPTSNICTRAVDRIENHPMPKLASAGVIVTVNSDDPGMFHTTLGAEYAIAHDVFGCDTDGLADLARASVHASYAPDSVRRPLLDEIDAYVTSMRNGWGR